MRFFTLLCIVLFSFESYAQPAEFAATDAPRLSDSRLFDAMSDLRNKKIRKGAPPANIKGSYYFTDNFRAASVTYFGQELKGEVLLRYNAYNDELEIGKTTDQKDTDEILLKSAKVVATIADEEYKLLSYKAKEDAFPKNGYFIVLVEGAKFSLYLQQKKVFMDAKEARTGLERSFPARFVSEENFFYQLENGTLLPLKKSKSGLKKVFSSQESELTQLLKKEKLKPNNIQDLKRIFQAFN